MKKFFGYIRVSTVKQGEKGSSLQEQRSAIEGFAQRHGLSISEWFEELETAAKQGRPIFARMFKALDGGKANGVIIHKIDRSARNLKDWARLGELIDRGIEVHFAHESIDLTSRGGRLAADIQAVVAADYIRNLRDEVRKGFYGRLKQGLYPLGAPLGYVDNGGGKPKTIDPFAGRLVAAAFDLYASELYSLQTLRDELDVRGLRPRKGARLSVASLAHLLKNPFYVGLIRIKKADEVFQGIHEPLVDKALFDRVQTLLRRREPKKVRQHCFRYQRLIRCMGCGHFLVAEHQKGYVYYRCHSQDCPMTGLREERIDEFLRQAGKPFHLTDKEAACVEADIETEFAAAMQKRADEVRSLGLAIAAIDERLARITDALIEGILDRATFLTRKATYLDERTTLVAKQAALGQDAAQFRARASEILELTKSLGNLGDFAKYTEFRDLLKETSSNLRAYPKTLEICWLFPFSELEKLGAVQLGPLHRDKARTGQIAKAILEGVYRGGLAPADNSGSSLPPATDDAATDG